MNPVELPQDLSLDNPWSLTEQGFSVITDTIREHMADKEDYTILELGSGVSTYRLCQTFPKAMVISVDHNSTTRFTLDHIQSKYGQVENMVLVLVPLRFGINVKELSYIGYDLRLEYVQHRSGKRTHMPFADCIIIDGPPFYILGGRELAIHQAYARLKPGGLMIVDDFNRMGEKMAVYNAVSLGYNLSPGGLDIKLYYKPSKFETNRLVAFLKYNGSEENDDLYVSSGLRVAQFHLQQKIIAARGALSMLDSNTIKYHWNKLFRDDWSFRSDSMVKEIYTAYGLTIPISAPDYWAESACKLLHDLWYDYKVTSI